MVSPATQSRGMPETELPKPVFGPAWPPPCTRQCHAADGLATLYTVCTLLEVIPIFSGARLCHMLY